MFCHFCHFLPFFQVHDMMDDIAEQQDVAKEISEAISNPVAFGSVSVCIQPGGLRLGKCVCVSPTRWPSAR